MLIREISFAEISEVWRTDLWPDRKSAIEPVSAINLRGDYDMSFMSSVPYFWGAFADFNSKSPVGVVSGFQTEPSYFRSRGIWVHPAHRRQGVGSLLLEQVVNQATSLKCQYVWTMPRVSSWSFYERNGFRVSAKTEKFEFGPHYLAVKPLIGKNL